MTKTDFTFGGWYKDAGFVTPWDFAADKVGGNITLYAKWVADDTVLNQQVDGYNGNAAVVSRAAMPEAEKTLVINGFAAAINGADEWYKNLVSSGGFALKLYIENGEPAGAEEDGMHKTSAQAQAMTAAEIVSFMISRGHEKPAEVIDEIMNETLSEYDNSVIISRSPMTSADKTAVRSAFIAAYDGVDEWYKGRDLVVKLYVENGGTNANEAGYIHKDLAGAKALTAAQIEQFYNDNNLTKPEQLPEQLTVSFGTAWSRVPLEAAEKTAVQTAINNAANDASFAYYKVAAHGKTITIWVENGKTAGSESGAMHKTYAEITGYASDAELAEAMAQIIDAGANLNKSVPSQYTGTKATIKTDLWLTASEWSTIKSNIEGALNAQNWWKDNVSASQLKVAVGGSESGYANLSQTQANAGTSTIWPILETFLGGLTPFKVATATVNGWTVISRVPLSSTDNSTLSTQIGALGWYKTNAGSFNKLFVYNDGPNNTGLETNGTNGKYLTQSQLSTATSEIVAWLNGKGNDYTLAATETEYATPTNNLKLRSQASDVSQSTVNTAKAAVQAAWTAGEFNKNNAIYVEISSSGTSLSGAGTSGSPLIFRIGTTNQAGLQAKFVAEFPNELSPIEKFDALPETVYGNTGALIGKYIVKNNTGGTVPMTELSDPVMKVVVALTTIQSNADYAPHRAKIDAGLVIRISLESTGSAPSNNGGVVYIPYSWLSRADIAESNVLSYLDGYITSTSITQAMPKQQDNFQVILGEQVLASVMGVDNLFGVSHRYGRIDNTGQH